VTTVRISLFDTEEQVRELRPDLERRLAEVVESGRFILGPEVSAFERSFAEYLGVEHVIGVGNGTDALTIAPTARLRRHGPPSPAQAAAMEFIDPKSLPFDPDTSADDRAALEEPVDQTRERSLAFLTYGIASVSRYLKHRAAAVLRRRGAP